VPHYRLPDGRTIEAERTADARYWHLRIKDDPGAEFIGTPLNSTLAELLGYEVAQEQWPSWIDDLASQIENALGGHRRMLAAGMGSEV
jgi:hypothetical protein